MLDYKDIPEGFRLRRDLVGHIRVFLIERQVIQTLLSALLMLTLQRSMQENKCAGCRRTTEELEMMVKEKFKDEVIYAMVVHHVKTIPIY